ncbi:MAG: 2OG-Fe(II) oxygenase [Candidatus Binatia bacterium]|nr:2OG-Fe(II) oxygenase [Candidatus Binatia bacterium]
MALVGYTPVSRFKRLASRSTEMLSFQDLNFDYEPYPIGVVAPVLAAESYRALVDAFPPLGLFGAKEDLGHKYSLSEVNHGDAYHDYVRASPPWLDFYRYVKSPDFIHQTMASLASSGVDLGLADCRVQSRSRFDGSGKALAALPGGASRSLGSAEMSVRRLLTRKAVLGARFEFSILPGDGGHILPHTDAPQKLVTLVISMLGPDEWSDSWGGGTQVLRPKDPAVAFNKMNRYLGFDEVEPVRTLPFRSNQCVVFVKTFNSLHAVPPVGGGAQVLRRTLTINIERLDTQP